MDDGLKRDISRFSSDVMTDISHHGQMTKGWNMMKWFSTASWQPFALLGLQIIAHLGFIGIVLSGNGILLLVSLLIYCLTGCIGMTVTYHRLLSHRSWKSPKWFEKIGSLIGAFGLVGSPIAWVAVHREHHRYSDRALDPHSPQVFPWWRVQWLSMFEPVKLKYAGDLLRSDFQQKLHSYYFHIHGSILIIGLIISPLWTAVLYLAPAAILWNAGSMINTLNHMWGYRQYETSDLSSNNHLTGYLVFGEGWHNNHHAKPSDPRFGKRWWEVDIGWWVIRFLKNG